MIADYNYAKKNIKKKDIDWTNKGRAGPEKILIIVLTIINDKTNKKKIFLIIFFFFYTLHIIFYETN